MTVDGPPRFVPSLDDPNIWGADGHHTDETLLREALETAFRYFGSDYDNVPDACRFEQSQVGLFGLEWHRCDVEGRSPNEPDPATQLKPVTWADLQPEDETDELDPVDLADDQDRYRDAYGRYLDLSGQIVTTVGLHAAGQLDNRQAGDTLTALLADVIGAAADWRALLVADGS